MKKNLIVMAAFVMVAFVFTGCEKCLNCTYADTTLLVSPGETCGDKDALDLLETGYETAAAAAGTTVTCTRD